jgi:hypothetical protein
VLHSPKDFYEHRAAEFKKHMAELDALHGVIWQLVLAGMILAFALGVLVGRLR